MSSQQGATSIPQINTSTASIPSPDTTTPGREHQCSPANATQNCTPDRSTLAHYNGIQVKSLECSPVPRVQTPPASEFRDTTYFSHRGIRSANRHTQNTIPSDNSLTPCLSPGRSSGGSRHSSDAGHSPCSNDSSELLTPPNFQADIDNPPYKPRRASDHSLTMVNYRRAGTLPHGKGNRSRKSHQHHRRCRHKMARYQRRAEHSHSGCQVAPTASMEHKHICQGHAGHQIPRMTDYGSPNTYGRLFSATIPFSPASGAGPSLTRRWSSVEVGTHPIKLESKLSGRTATSEWPKSPEDDRFEPIRPDKRFRSSMFTRGVIDHDIICTIRETLTTHQLPFPQLETPEQITLRRASATTGAPGAATIGRTPTNEILGNQTPRAYLRTASDERRGSAAYIITKRDIDSITELVQANLKRNYRPHDHVDMNPKTPPIPQRVRTPTFGGKGVVIGLGIPAESVITTAEVRRSSKTTYKPVNYLQVQPMDQKMPKSISPARSMNEIIWQGDEVPTVFRSATDEEGTGSSSSKSTSHVATNANTPHQHGSRTPMMGQSKADKGDAFDPKNAHASINEWSWRCPQHESAVVVNSSDSESNEVTPSSEVPPKIDSGHFLPSHQSGRKARQVCKVTSPPRASMSKKNKFPDVVSFPPLPTRKTNDWYSPLPPVDSPPLTTSKSLYELGLDVNCGPEGSNVSSIKTLTPKASRTSWIRTTESSLQASRNSSVEFDPNYEIRRKSVIKTHPKAAPRTGESSAVGSAIGTSSGERRKSSNQNITQGIKRVRTIDNKQKGERGGTWSRIRPPSICPPAKIPSPAELAVNEEEEFQISSAPVETKAMKTGIVERLRLIRDKSPPTPKVDHVGIYGKLTGTSKSSLGDDNCLMECTPHVCDDCAVDPRNPSIDWIG